MSLQHPVPSAPPSGTENGWRPRGSEPRTDPRDPRLAAGRDGGAGGERLPRPPRRRNAGLAALAVLLVAGGAVVAGLLALRIDDRVDMLVARDDIAAGTRITADMLAVAPVATQGLALIPATEQASVVGQYAAVPIAKERLLDRGMLTGASVLRPGTVALGVAIAPGQAPGTPLEAGDLVAVYGTDGEGSVLATDAVVQTVDLPEASTFGAASDVSVVTLVVPADAAAKIAAASGGGKVALARVGRAGRSPRR
ncbi:SAF domain-containing protein, partial [Kineosporia sp. A_224]|uniref:SAF domain-containing protein n=1 Tax=Kineosporia sp. A_224 TaxID=1962180 RepID=UPI001E4A071A